MLSEFVEDELDIQPEVPLSTVWEKIYPYAWSDLVNHSFDEAIATLRIVRYLSIFCVSRTHIIQRIRDGWNIVDDPMRSGILVISSSGPVDV